MFNPYMEEWSGLGDPLRPRPKLVDRYAWAVPNERAIKAIASEGLTIEVGAGGGYWAFLVQQMGGEILPTEKNLTAYPKPWTEVQEGLAADAPAISLKANLLLCWPAYNDPMAFDALSTWLDGNGRFVFYVGEGPYGCTADERFFDLADKTLEIVDYIRIPQWAGIRDYLTIYKRKQS